MIDDVIRYIGENEKKYVEVLAKYVTYPSIADDAENTRRCAEFLKELMENAGIETYLCETAGNPILYGELRASDPNAPTVLFYGHYDVQPVEPLAAWTSPPFEGTIRDGRMFARGVADNKGQHLAHLFATQAFLKTEGDVPIHCKFIFEGEEEAGSKHLPHFVTGHRDMLACDIVYVSDGPMDKSDVPAICFGNRGVFNFAIEVETSTTDNHSGNKGGVIPNAAWELNHLLSTMIDRDGNVLIEGFYDDVQPPTPYELELVDRMPYDPDELANIFGVERIDLDKATYYRNLCFRPTLTINALGCGSPDDVKNIVPARAVAKLDVRLVANQKAGRILRNIERHVAKTPLRGRVAVRHEGADMHPSKTDPGLPICRDIVDAVRAAFGRNPVVQPVMGGSLPNDVWTEHAGLPVISVPYANVDEANHAPNENLRLDCYIQGIRTTAHMLNHLRGRRYGE
ncbi:M20/M25/M40 family metallo-hydrolase [Synergistaceae bacterium OttesenSCG-928-I11]|nr:M20/M25/M40 family metallo-hydrolase [Synergistaceae bacterium OttesenSCG-928-I11]